MMNNTTLEQPIGEDGMSMGLGARAVWDSLFVAMIVVAIVGNLIVLWIILGKAVTCMSILFVLNYFKAQSTNTIRVTINECICITYIGTNSDVRLTTEKTYLIHPGGDFAF